MSFASVIRGMGPVAHWRVGEPSGTNANDEIGSNDGTYVASPTLGAAGSLTVDSNKAVALNGTTQWITVADSSPFRFAGTAAFSVVVAFKHVADATFRRVVSCEDPANGQGWQLYSQSAAWAVVRTDGGGSAEAGPAVAAGADWVYAGATYDGVNLQLYKNGAASGSPAASAQSLPSTATFRIGAHPADVSAFNGTIDEVAIFARALSAAEVAIIYAARDDAAGRKVLRTLELLAQ